MSPTTHTLIAFGVIVASYAVYLYFARKNGPSN